MSKYIWKEKPYKEYHYGHIIEKLISYPYGWTKVPLFQKRDNGTKDKF